MDIEYIIDLIRQNWPDMEYRNDDDEGIIYVGPGGSTVVLRLYEGGQAYAVKYVIRMVQNERNTRPVQKKDTSRGDSAQGYDPAKQELDIFQVLSPLSGNIVQLVDSCQLVRNGHMEVLMKMELLRPLDAVIGGGEWLSTDEKIRLVREMLQGLAACHGAGYAHRDVKPGNLFRNIQGVWQIGDFSISIGIKDKQKASEISFTEDYAAPEVRQAGRDRKQEPQKMISIDWCRADVYSAGLVMYYLLNDYRLPWAGQAREERENIREQAGGFSLPGAGNDERMNAWSKVIERATQKDPVKRFADAGKMLQALNAIEAPSSKKWKWISLAVAGAVVISAGSFAAGRLTAPANTGTTDGLSAVPILTTEETLTTQTDGETVVAAEQPVEEEAAPQQAAEADPTGETAAEADGTEETVTEETVTEEAVSQQPETITVSLPDFPVYGSSAPITGTYSIPEGKAEDYRVTLYLRTKGSYDFFVKPSNLNPVTTLKDDFSFSLNYTIGNDDSKAVEMYLFLVKSDFVPDSDIERTRENALHETHITRTSSGKVTIDDGKQD